MVAFGLASCEQLGSHQETATTLLRAFCALHRSDIIQVLLTPEQQRAGEIVCQAVGLRMGGT